jgi:hypothetical protein
MNTFLPLTGLYGMPLRRPTDRPTHFSSSDARLLKGIAIGIGSSFLIGLLLMLLVAFLG